MIPDIITSYEDLIRYGGNGRTVFYETLFWFIEYNSNNPDYSEIEKYSLLRNECLQHPLDFKDRLDKGIYKVWTRIPF